MMLNSAFDDITLSGNDAVSLRELAARLEIRPEELANDALRLLRITVENGLYVKKGRLTSDAPVIHALGLWRQLALLDATGRIEASTSQGPVAFKVPREAFQPPAWGQSSQSAWHGQQSPVIPA